MAAIGVCQTVSPAIAARQSADSGAAVGRTSLKPRNPANAPDDWQRAVLEDFERRHAPGAAASEYFAVLPDGSARYMRAIPTQPACLACHGSQLAPQVSDVLRARYPEDRATGFAVGDLRGAFWVDWPAPAE